MTTAKSRAIGAMLSAFLLGPAFSAASPHEARQLLAQLEAAKQSAVAFTRSKEFTAGCVTAPYSTIVSGPSVTATIHDGSEEASLSVWRVPCSNTDAQLLVTFVPTVGSPFVCSSLATLIQAGLQFDSVSFSRADSGGSLCDDLFVSTTVWLDPGASSGVSFNDDAAFTMIYDGLGSGEITLQVPAYDPGAYGGGDEGGDFSISSRIGGSWYEPSMSGQGWFFEADDASNLFVMAWFTWQASSGTQDWFTGVGTYSGPNAQVTLYRSSGGRFVSTAPVTSTPVGTATVEFSGCTAALLEFEMDDGRAGSLDITRITPVPEGCR